MSVIPRPMTYDDLLQMPQDGSRYEVVEGEPIVAPSPSQVHQELIVRLLALILAYLSEQRLGGKIYPAPLDVRLSEHSIVQPDLIYIRPERRAIRADPAFIDGAPDLVVEVLSPSNRPYDELIKYRLYERAGMPEYWLVDPEREFVTIFVLRDGGYVPTAAHTALIPSTVLPGLVIDVPALFADLD